MSDEKNTNTDADNYNFVQLSRGYLKQMRYLARKSPLAHEILYYFVEHMGRTTNAVVCSYKVLTEVMGVSRTSVANAIQVLKNDNWIDAVKIGNATAYCVNDRVFWQAARNQRKYAIFSATVVAAESEQPSDYHTKSKQKLTHVPFVQLDERITLDESELPPPDQLDIDLN